MNQNWKNNEGDVCPASISPAWILNIRILGAAARKMRKLILAMVLVMGKENEENGKVMPRFQSRNDSSLDQLQAEHLLQCYLSDSQLHSGKTKAASTPKAAHLFSTCSWIFPMNNTLEV